MDRKKAEKRRTKFVYIYFNMLLSAVTLTWQGSCSYSILSVVHTVKFVWTTPWRVQSLVLLVTFFPRVVACECINLYQSGHVDTGLKISVFKLFGAKASAGKSAKITFLRFSPVRKKKEERKCGDLKCVQKPTRGRLSLTHLPVQPLSMVRESV